MTILGADATSGGPRPAPSGPGPLDGFRVVEVAMWVAGPSVAAVLADWGADVVKVEPAGGDPLRSLFGVAGAGDPGLPDNPIFDLSNRGKRSIAVDLKDVAGRTVLDELIAGADVLVTNLRVQALERLGLTFDAVHDRFPRLVYCLVTGFGEDGPERDTPGYDTGAFWARSGIAASLTAPGCDPPFQRGAMGDRPLGAALAGAVAAALLVRERTGVGQKVSSSLYRWGTYTLASDLSVAMHFGQPMAVARREAMGPTVNTFRCADGRWIWMIGIERDRHWPLLAQAMGHPEWLDESRSRDVSALVAEMDLLFATRPREDWLRHFATHGVWCQPVHTATEVLEDPQFYASGAVVDVVREGFSTAMMNSPVDFSATPAGPRALAPAVGEHTDEILGALGHGTDDVARLREAGSVA